MQPRNTKGQFARKIGGFIKKTTLVIFALLVLGGLVYGGVKVQAQKSVQTYVSKVTPTQPTRLQQTKALIDSLVEQRKKDPTFIKETERQIEELKKGREMDARLDAIMIVKTQLGVEVDDIIGTSTKKK